MSRPQHEPNVLNNLARLLANDLAEFLVDLPTELALLHEDDHDKKHAGNENPEYAQP